MFGLRMLEVKKSKKRSAPGGRRLPEWGKRLSGGDEGGKRRGLAQDASALH